MWLKWLPYRFILKHVARAQGFGDPFQLLSRFMQFSQPSEFIAPTELLRAGAVLYARGLINYQAIQHNLDWIWPHWVEKQFNPHNPSFVPRAFSRTHINITHRNWTAVAIPGLPATPVVDPRGLVMPFFDSFSIDAWIICPQGEQLIPSRLDSVSQALQTDGNLAIVSRSASNGLGLVSATEVQLQNGQAVCKIRLRGRSPKKSLLIVALRPYNPEGVSFIHEIELLGEAKGWKVNDDQEVRLPNRPEQLRFSEYRTGDVYFHLLDKESDDRSRVVCDVGMATAAAVYELQPDTQRDISVEIPLGDESAALASENERSEALIWQAAVENLTKLKIPVEQTQFLYDASIRTILTHASDKLYAGPYTYKRFWFRDAAFILHSMLAVGLFERARQVIETFFDFQNSAGCFVSQEGEWDSNGQALWIMQRFCQMTGSLPPPHWRHPIQRGCRWIVKKRLPSGGAELHAGLLPAGFSAEHFGPNDYYYWDDFWSIAGLQAGAALLSQLGETADAAEFQRETDDFLKTLDNNLQQTAQRIGSRGIPASPYRRLDSAAVGSMVFSYPLQLCPPDDPRIMQTAEYLMDNCMIDHGFFHHISHAGINAYLSFHIAQALLRNGDLRYSKIFDAISDLASPTGQWPEAIHPRLKTGCMGDGQHVWAASEWLMMLRNCFVREEVFANRLILCSGLSADWLHDSVRLSFEPAPTVFGTASVSLERVGRRLTIGWEGSWHGQQPSIEIRLPGYPSRIPQSGETTLALDLERDHS
jgi:hypothetical protein